MRRFKTFVPLALAVALSGCAQNTWRVAREADTAEAYRTFLRDHPDHENAEAARAHLEEREFERASKGHSVLAFKRYLEEFPDSAHAPAARLRLEGLRFSAAKETGTSAALRQFLRDHPEGTHREEAERLLVEAEFRETDTESATPEERVRLVRARPEDPRRVQLEQRLDTEAFERARAGDSAFGYYAYLRDFPAGSRREQAQARLFGLRMRGLLLAGRIDDARREIERSPLTASVPELQAWLAAAETTQRLVLQTKDVALQSATAEHYLRDARELEQALGAPDPLDRWQAAEELGHHAQVTVLEPLFSALRTARNPLIRAHALDSLRRVLAALPKEVAEYELATRIESLAPNAGSAETWLQLAVLWDLAGRLDEAAALYGRAWDRGAPDPVVLRRWIEIRQLRRQPFSAAVAARQLALWSAEVARDLEPPRGRDARIAVSDVRQLCAAAEYARHALSSVRAVKAQVSDFPDDVVRFELEAVDAVRLAEARLGDAELLLRTQDPHARTCGDARVAERVGAGERARAAALENAAKRRKDSEGARLVLERAKAQDPSEALRRLAATLLVP